MSSSSSAINRTDAIGARSSCETLETTSAGLAAYEQDSQAAMQDPQWRILYQKFSPFVDSGYREIFSIVG